MHHRTGTLWVSMLVLAGCLVQATAAADPAGPDGGQATQGTRDSEEIISEIRFVGNRRTKPETMLREMLVKVGDPVDPERIEESRQAIMDLELFKSVRADLVPDAAGRVLVIEVTEKRFVFVLPALSRSGEGDITFGVRGKADNLWGRNHLLDVELKRKNLKSDADVDHERTLEIHYDYRRVADGPWELDVLARYQRALLEEERSGMAGEFERDTARLQWLAARWKRARGPSRGWRFGAGVSYEDFDFELIEGDPDLFFDTSEVGIMGRVDYRNVRNYEFSRSGREFGLKVETFSDSLGSAKDRLQGAVVYRSYNSVAGRRYTNLNFQLRGAATTESLFGDPTFSIGGASSLRGYDRENIEGDAYLLANIEFLTPISKLDALRGVLFADFGDAFDRPADATLNDLKAAMGVGLRWRIRRFVKLDLRLDVAHGLDETQGGDTKAYVGTDATF